MEWTKSLLRNAGERLFGLSGRDDDSPPPGTYVGRSWTPQLSFRLLTIVLTCNRGCVPSKSFRAGAKTPGERKWMGVCLFCKIWFRSGDTHRRVFSNRLGQYRDCNGDPIPLDCLRYDTDRYFHDLCVRRSERQSPRADSLAEATSFSAASDDAGYTSAVFDEIEGDAVENLHRLATSTMAVSLPASGPTLRETVVLEAPRPPLAALHGPLLRRTSTRCVRLFPYFSATYHPIGVLTSYCDNVE